MDLNTALRNLWKSNQSPFDHHCSCNKNISSFVCDAQHLEEPLTLLGLHNVPHWSSDIIIHCLKCKKKNLSNVLSFWETPSLEMMGNSMAQLHIFLHTFFPCLHFFHRCRTGFFAQGSFSFSLSQRFLIFPHVHTSGPHAVHSDLLPSGSRSEHSVVLLVK